MNAHAVIASFAVPWLAIAAMAQHRAPCTGTVRDGDGKPLANAEVVCAFEPDSTTLGAPDRVTARTDAEGRFAADLFVGDAYVVWVVGPPGARGERVMARPRQEAAGGKVLELVAEERRDPVKLQVKGTTPWIKDGPLALRIVLPGRCALGPDLLIPGDGTIGLPPLPATRFVVQLIDGRHQPIQSQALDLDVDAGVTFPEPREATVLATDPDGKPLAGVQVMQSVDPVIAALGPLPRAHGRLPWQQRVLAITGADGQATIRVPKADNRLLQAHLAGHADSISGWLDHPRATCLHDGREVADEGPLRFVLRPSETTTLRVLGTRADEHVQVVFRSALRIRFHNGAGMVQICIAATAHDQEFRGDGPDVASGTGARIRVLDDSPLPRRIVVTSYAVAARLPDVDLASLRTFPLTVVDAEQRPVPCAQVGSAMHTEGFPVYWVERLVTDAQGRAELRVDDKLDLDVYATTGAAHGVHVLGKQDPPGPLRIRLEPLQTARLRVVDSTGRPVARAHLEYTGGSLGGSSDDEAGKALDRIAGSVTEVALGQAVSDADGVIRLAYPACDGVTAQFKVLAGNLTAAGITLRPGDRAEPIVVK